MFELFNRYIYGDNSPATRNQLAEQAYFIRDENNLKKFLRKNQPGKYIVGSMDFFYSYFKNNSITFENVFDISTNKFNENDLAKDKLGILYIEPKKYGETHYLPPTNHGNYLIFTDRSVNLNISFRLKPLEFNESRQLLSQGRLYQVPINWDNKLKELDASIQHFTPFNPLQTPAITNSSSLAYARPA